MDASTLRKKLEDKEDLVIVDCREPAELKQYPGIPGSVNIPMSKAREAIKSLPLDKKIVTVCSVGVRGKHLSDALNELGYDSDYLEGGLDAW